MQQGFQRLSSIAQRLKEDRDKGFAPNPPTHTPRELTSWYGYERRSPLVVARIREDLESCGLLTDPDFLGAGADDKISIADSSTSIPPEDATLRVHMLAAARNKPMRVTPNDQFTKAKTLMAGYDFSQVPVMTSDRDVKGIITWKSIGSTENPAGTQARHFMDESVQVIVGRRPLFEAVDIIANHGYTLVRGEDNTITGIVTATDLNYQLLQLTEAFLLVGEIEGHIQRIIYCRFTYEEVLDSIKPSDADSVKAIGDLTFGDYCRLLEEPKRWAKLELQDDRATFVRQLDEVRKVRNDVMHFNFNGPSASDLQKLRALAPFFRSRAYPPGN